MDPKEIEQTPKFKKILASFHEYEDTVLSDISEHDKTENEFIQCWENLITTDLKMSLSRYEKRCTPSIVTYERQGETVTREIPGYSTMEKYAIVNCLNHFCGIPITEATRMLAMDRRYFYEIKTRIKDDDSTEEQYFEELEHLTRQADETLEVFYKQEIKALIALCGQLDLLGYSVGGWLQDQDTAESTAIDLLLRDVREYSGCNNYRDLKLFEYIYVQKVQIRPLEALLCKI